MLLQAVGIASLVMAVLSCLLFFALLFAARRAPAPASAEVVTRGAVDDVTKLVEQLEKLAGTLSKVAPWLSALIAAMFFLTIAFAASAADELSDKLPEVPTSATTPTR